MSKWSAPSPEVRKAKRQLNDAVVALVKKGHRPEAVAILARFGLLNTVKIKPEDIAPVHAAFEEALAKLNASETK